MQDRREYTRQWRKTPQAKLSRRQWYAKTYVPHPLPEVVDDPDLIRARVEAVLRAKQEKWIVYRTTRSLSDEQVAALVLPGDEEVRNATC